jgi:hypothetical protein
MNFKLKTLVAALALSVVATSANAAIDANNGNSELFFSAWDSNAGVGYTYDLNWNKFLNDFVGIDQAATAAGNTTLKANATVGASMIGAGGVIYDQALTGMAFANTAAVEWNLAAYDQGNGRNRLLMTLGDSGLPFASGNNQIKAAVTALSAYTPQANGKILVPATDTFVNTVVGDGAAYAGNAGSTYKDNIADTTTLLGAQATSLWFLAPDTQNSSVVQSTIQQQLFAFDGRAVTANTYLNATDSLWHLQIAAVPVAAVPEADTSAMMLAGLGLMGFIARRRRNSLTK